MYCVIYCPFAQSCLSHGFLCPAFFVPAWSMDVTEEIYILRSDNLTFYASVVIIIIIIIKRRSGINPIPPTVKDRD